MDSTVLGLLKEICTLSVLYEMAGINSLKVINLAAVSVGKVPVTMRLSAGFSRPKLPPV